MLNRTVEVIRSLRHGFRKRYGHAHRDPIVVSLYRGYRSATRLFAQARVQEDEGIRVAQGDRRWRNFINAVRRFESDEVAGANLKLRYDGKEYLRTADAEGYVTLHEAVEEQLTATPDGTITASITSLPNGTTPPIEGFKGEIFDLTGAARYGVITDIDDTLLKTGVTSLFKLRALFYTLVDNAHTRLPFAGAAEFFSALHAGPGEAVDNNPIFYLSRSPWNLYDMLEQFLDLRGFPRGPVFLRDVGFGYMAPGSEAGHKLSTILRLIDDFPSLQFVLVGDSGEKDADIYREVATQYPERIKAIIIRNVKNNANARRVARMFKRRNPKEHYYLVKDSAEAAERLAELGLLSDVQVATVREAMQVKQVTADQLQ